MTDRERLIELIAIYDNTYDCADCADFRDSESCGHECLADYLLKNGVTLPKPKFIRPPADLTGKCGSCIYSKPYEGESRTFKSYVECTNEEHLKKYCYRSNSKYRQRTALACKRYQERSVSE